jgi:hypothetical protein
VCVTRPQKARPSPHGNHFVRRASTHPRAGSGLDWVDRVFHGFTAGRRLEHPHRQLELRLTDSITNTQYLMSIYDQAGDLVRSCPYPAATGCSVNVSPPSGQVRGYRAYVATDAPATGVPSGVRAASQLVVVSAVAEADALDSDAVTTYSTQLLATYGAQQACLMIGETARTHAMRSSVPDVTLICSSRGLKEALRFHVATGRGLEMLATLVDASTGTPPDTFHPDCDALDALGDCVATDSPAEPTPEPVPQPDPAGAGISPPGNCLADFERDVLLGALPQQNHHMATDKTGSWLVQFQAIASQYGLDVSDPSGQWNLFNMPHQGAHPWNYHNWVYQNMVLADEAAWAQYPDQADLDLRKAVFLDLFDKWVVEVALHDPTITRAGYWKCRSFYKWR